MDDVGLANPISTAISVLNSLVSAFVLLMSIGDRSSGGPAFWIGAAAVLFLIAVHALVKDVRRLRAGPPV
ncbi:hypothetical protein ACIQXD_26080 [Streptomyces uncialis]|uniref:hypothetical protein n=1 Tax=Streptomyces uncialis TaxID=1048205 RepID=UPI00381DF40A